MFDDYEGSRAEFLKMLAEQGEEPAFLRRSRQVEEVLEQLRRECQTRRTAMLHGPRLHLRKLDHVVRGNWSKLSSFLVDQNQWTVFEELLRTWNSESPPPKWSNPGGWSNRISRPLKAFYRSVDRFNEAWCRYLDAFDLGTVNGVIENFNEYYPMEKAFAFGREDIERLGFTPYQLFTTDQLKQEFPPVNLPPLE